MEPLDRPGRRLALGLTLAGTALFYLLAATVRRSSRLWIDVEGQRLAFGHVLGVSIMSFRLASELVRLGTTAFFLSSVAILVVAALTLRDRLSATVALLAAPVAVLATEKIGKPLIGRQEGHGYGFPSGHTTVIATVVAILALIAYREWHWRGLAVVAPVALVVPLMAVAVVRVNFHRFSDSVGGILVGFGTVLGIAWLVSMAVLAWRRPTRVP
ncbi:MAG TPA: phosphatase PAP2 family protein [Acidimicrobiales bacterium]|nr:phosphatase PAP2 family protein [Acidimicrobiales bacterium]